MWLPSFHDLLLLVSYGSALMDIRCGKVDNHWLLLCSICGLGLRGLRGGPEWLAAGLAGMLLPFLLLGWLSVFHMLGAGDIKLLCALGSFTDPYRSLLIVFVSFLWGSVLSLFILLRSGTFSRRFQYLYTYLQNVLETGRITPYIKRGVHREENIPFTVPIFLGISSLYIGGILL